MAARPRVVVAGAGIGGLTATLALLQRGFDVTVYEQTAELREVGAGLQMSANGTRVMHALGVLDPLLAVSVLAAGKEIRLWNTGQTWKLFDLGMASVETYGFPYLTVWRPDLLGVLADAVRRLRPDAIRLGMKAHAARAAGDRVVLEFEGGTHVECDVLVGADGLHSKVRQSLFGPDRPEFTGIMAWRGIIPMAKLPAHMKRLVGTNWVGPGGHIVHYPLRRGELMNWVGVVERDDWTIESWSTRGTVEECATDYRGWHDDIQTMIASIETPYKWALMGRAPMDAWTVGRVTLLGDACHPTLPFLAQGAVMAIEDGYVLARALDEIADPADALVRYEAARRERANRMVRGSAENAHRFHNASLARAEEAAAYVDREWAEDKVRERYEWLFRYDATRVPI
jgi:salicylate hydroxylase